jgi:hypothetical protein
MNKRAEQIRHIEQWRASGLSQSEYSRRHGLKMATFNYWVRHMDAKREYPLSRFNRPVRKYVPSCRVVHPFPSERFHVRTFGRSRMR